MTRKSRCVWCSVRAVVLLFLLLFFCATQSWEKEKQKYCVIESEKKCACVCPKYRICGQERKRDRRREREREIKQQGVDEHEQEKKPEGWWIKV